jgi:hypothetical protein
MSAGDRRRLASADVYLRSYAILKGGDRASAGAIGRREIAFGTAASQL